ncbi:phosphoglycerate mutase family protein [Patescibacteria group bacterium]|jgi:broad specificity phosphatase PhoE|nr:phosphoglycerate mutase family protein [Patescibacteria group bacterium]
MKTMYLVRHAEVENPHHVFYNGEYPLSKEGVRQAHELAVELAAQGIRPKRILTSPYVRARETAELLCQELGCDTVTDDRLIEWQVGDWFGKPLAEFRQAAGYNDHPPFELKLEDVESYASMAQRVSSVLYEELARLPEGGFGMVVGHREPLVSTILKLRGDTDWRNIPLLKMPRPSVWKLDFDGDRLASCNPVGFSVS